MTTYRVGEAGATVFDAGGRVLYRLPPGTVVVAGTIETAGSLAQQHQALASRVHDGGGPSGKRIRGYSDKRITPAEDKSP